jgi:hypothetical protein
MPLPILVQYNIPRYIVGKPGKQNHACTGEMMITPGICEVFEFVYSNNDGVPINLADFTLRLVFWFPANQYELLPANMSGNIVFAKDLIVEEPYAAKAGVLLTDQETLQIGVLGHSSLRWSIYMIDNLTDPPNTFATQITSQGDRYGICRLDCSHIPNAQTIMAVTVSPTVPS